MKIFILKNIKKFDHPSLVGPKSKFNNVGMITYSQNCKKITFDRLLAEPKMYFKHRFLAFLAGHGKFAFDYIYPIPDGWKNFIQRFIKYMKIKMPSYLDKQCYFSLRCTYTLQ